MPELKTIEEDFSYSLSFDIDDFIGDGVWWLQVYDSDKKLIYDKPFASSKGNLESHRIVETIKKEIAICERRLYEGTCSHNQ